MNKLYCNNCSKYVFNYKFYLQKFDDLNKNLLHTEIACINHWIQYGYKENRICSPGMVNFNNKILCADCFKYLISSYNLKKFISKIKILIIFQNLSRDCLQILKNKLDNYFTVKLIFDNNNLKNLIKDKDFIINFDLFLFNNINNFCNYNDNTSIYYINLINSILQKKKKVAFIPTSLCFDYYCPSAYNQHNYIHSKILTNKENKYFYDNLLDKIDLFLPKCHYENLINEEIDSFYNLKYYKKNKKFYLPPVIIKPNLLSKKQFFEFYNLDLNNKIIIYYCHRTDEVFQHNNHHELNLRIKKKT